jgi:hypothetical protein
MRWWQGCVEAIALTRSKRSQKGAHALTDQSSQPKASQASRSPYFWPLFGLIIAGSACFLSICCYALGVYLFGWISVRNSSLGIP